MSSIAEEDLLAGDEVVLTKEEENELLREETEDAVDVNNDVEFSDPEEDVHRCEVRPGSGTSAVNGNGPIVTKEVKGSRKMWQHVRTARKGPSKHPARDTARRMFPQLVRYTNEPNKSAFVDAGNNPVLQTSPPNMILPSSKINPLLLSENPMLHPNVASVPRMSPREESNMETQCTTVSNTKIEPANAPLSIVIENRRMLDSSHLPPPLPVPHLPWIQEEQCGSPCFSTDSSRTFVSATDGNGNADSDDEVQLVEETDLLVTPVATQCSMEDRIQSNRESTLSEVMGITDVVPTVWLKGSMSQTLKNMQVVKKIAVRRQKTQLRGKKVKLFLSGLGEAWVNSKRLHVLAKKRGRLCNFELDESRRCATIVFVDETAAEAFKEALLKMPNVDGRWRIQVHEPQEL